MKATVCYIFIVAICKDLSEGFVLHESTVNRTLRDLSHLIESTQENGVRVLVPSIVRLVFHDCIDGCDACLNLKLPFNKNLDKPIRALEPLYRKYKYFMSRADFWALASKAALDVGVDINNRRCHHKDCKTPKIKFRFRYGRVDCISSPHNGFETHFLSPFTSSSWLFNWFKFWFNLNRNSVVALMGLHTLGKARHPFNETWDLGNSDGVNNLYYKKIADPNHCWVQEYVEPQMSGLPHKIFYWRTDEFKGFALPVDMSLYKDVILNPTTGESSCTYHDCQNAKTMAMFRLYGEKAHIWTKHVGLAFPKIIEKTRDQLKWPTKVPLSS
ncbi:unnamed protein product [Lepeophtheirus salmonis]|uniref:(salmon louse) hypothetical protein n=1 Tax=Lepeophtheirus salmonis TaxID=72036 RepID=A0A7R8CW22_LEPSM|nr:unnamed protein product [Lepeophtheirus salmonis]CAF2918058.1 unnamed protein product [Lepeophtheirus salmonis]